MAEWAREGCCSFRCSRPSGSWRRFPAAEPAARLAEISPCMRHWPHRRRHLQEHWLSLDPLDTSACACPPRWNHCLALAPAALPSRPVSTVDTYNRNGFRGYELLLLKPKCTRRSKMHCTLEIDIYIQTVACKTIVLNCRTAFKDIDQDTWPMHNLQAYVYGSKTNIYSKEIDRKRTLHICPTWHRSRSLWNPPPEAHWNEQILLQVEKNRKMFRSDHDKEKMSKSDG